MLIRFLWRSPREFGCSDGQATDSLSTGLADHFGLLCCRLFSLRSRMRNHGLGAPSLQRMWCWFDRWLFSPWNLPTQFCWSGCSSWIVRARFQCRLSYEICQLRPPSLVAGTLQKCLFFGRHVHSESHESVCKLFHFALSLASRASFARHDIRPILSVFSRCDCHLVLLPRWSFGSLA